MKVKQATLLGPFSNTLSHTKDTFWARTSRSQYKNSTVSGTLPLGPPSRIVLCLQPSIVTFLIASRLSLFQIFSQRYGLLTHFRKVLLSFRKHLKNLRSVADKVYVKYFTNLINLFSSSAHHKNAGKVKIPLSVALKAEIKYEIRKLGSLLIAT